VEWLHLLSEPDVLITGYILFELKVIKTNLHIYPSYLTNESRILRESESLVKLGLVKTIVVAGYWREGLAETEEIRKDVVFYRLRTLVKKRSGVLKLLNVFSFPFFYWKVFSIYRIRKPEIVNCHSLTVLPLGVMIKLLFGTTLIYDPHELETETHDSKGLRKFFSKILERALIGASDFVIVVGQNISDWYKRKYALKRIEVIRNIPEKKVLGAVPSKLRDILKIRQDAIIFLYVGTLEKGRGISLLIESFTGIENNKHLVFMGYGSLKEFIVQHSRINPNIHCLDAVAPEMVVEYVAGADVGISIIENTCLSYYFCLPNKCFEYINAGVPFICSDFPELKNEFAKFDVSWFTALDKSDLHKLIADISKDQISRKKNNAIVHQGKWSWADEEKKYLSIYNGL
jgi:glycosyltransferase involved in cell wall biosynthesis